jgi:adenylyltransferase/sulfurtransferase
MMTRINPTVQVEAMAEGLTPENAIRVITPYDVVLDCTDNAPTRYLLSDSCVALRKPLVSGAAQRFEGQLCIYNLYNTGPCYRCFFPRPPAQDTVGTCADTGVLGAVTGIIGNLQALETIKLLTGFSGEYHHVHVCYILTLFRTNEHTLVILSAFAYAFSNNQASSSQAWM